MKTYAGEQTLAAFSSIVKTALAESGGGQSAPGGVPVGAVMIWPGTVDTIPSNWALCDGQDGRPDYRDIFLLGAGPNHAVGSTGGEETHKLTISELAAHSHPERINTPVNGGNSVSTACGISTGLEYLPYNTSTGASTLDHYGVTVNKVSSNKIYNNNYTDGAGGSQPHNNMPPYKAVLFIIKIAPDPALDGVTMDMVYAAIAEAMASAGGGVPAGAIVDWSGAADSIPDGWALCDGTNGTPDLRGKFVLGAGPSYEVGATGGEETHTLTEGEMPSHRHPFDLPEYESSGSNSLFSLSKSTQKGAIFTRYTKLVGGGTPHNNMPPYYVLAKIMKL